MLAAMSLKSPTSQRHKVMAGKQHTAIRTICTFAGEMQRLVDSGNLESTQVDWCELVLRNNAPGERIHAHAEMLLACENAAGIEVHRANIRR